MIILRSLSQLILVAFFSVINAQSPSTDSIRNFSNERAIVESIEQLNTPNQKVYNPKIAGLYSAVLPGLGQYYNKKYWKIPIVWGAIGTGVGIMLWNQKQYSKYKDAFVAELSGQPHEFSGINGVDARVLGNMQDRMKRQRDYAIAITIGLYLLNIVDAVVDAHLHEQRNDPDLALHPTLLTNPWAVQYKGKLGLSLNYRF